MLANRFRPAWFRSICAAALAGLLLVTALASGVLPAHVDDGVLGRSGETVIPLIGPDIRMAAEEVILTLDGMRTLADLTFTFTNDGPARTVLMGFPVGKSSSGLRGVVELHDFKIRPGGAIEGASLGLGHRDSAGRGIEGGGPVRTDRCRRPEPYSGGASPRPGP